jgi:hypothetical protein
MIKPPEDYKSSELDAFLNQCMIDITAMRRERLENLADRFRRSMDFAAKLFGNSAFRKLYPDQDRKLPINKALLEAWAVTLDRLDDEQIATLVANRNELRARFIQLLTTDIAFSNSISFGTGDINKVKKRFSAIGNLARGIINVN